MTTVGRIKCSNCIWSECFNDPIFVGVEKVFARIVTNYCMSKLWS